MVHYGTLKYTMVIENVQKQVFDQIIFRFLFHHFVVSVVALKSSWSVLQDILTFFQSFVELAMQL